MQELRGTPVLVNIWASWCGPCRREAPLLARAGAAYGNDVQFLGVDILDDRTDAASFITRYDIRYPTVFDPSGDIRNQLGFIGVPETVFYDRRGVAASVWTSPLTDDALRDGLKAIGASSPSSGSGEPNVVPTSPYGPFPYANSIQKQAFQAYLRCAADLGVLFRGPFAASNGNGVLFGHAPGEKISNQEQMKVSRHCPQAIVGTFATPGDHFDYGLFVRAATEFAQCIRAHGYPDFVLPAVDREDPYAALEQLRFEWYSPRFTAAMRACLEPLHEYVFGN
jgi:hypothetical protein